MAARVRLTAVCVVALALALGGVAAAQGTTEVQLTDVHWDDAKLRWRDADANLYATARLPGGGQEYNYSQASVTLTYNQVDTTFVAHLEAHGLKPNFAYQVKLNGKPDMDPWANEQLGNLGRWWDDEGYLIFEFFVTDDAGSAIVDFSLDSSLHVLWKTTQQPPWGDCTDPIVFDVVPENSPTWYDTPYPPDELDLGVYAEPEPLKPPVGGVALPEGHYDVKIFITEESFHEDGLPWGPLEEAGDWATVLAHDEIQFTVLRQATKYWAVVCGIANYKALNDLTYTDDDARDLVAALGQFDGWQGADQIELLLDAAASKNGIREAIARMGQKANAVAGDRDVCLFFFSGHGTRVVDSSGEEADGYDEAICPYDMRVAGFKVKNVLTDDELAGWLADSLPADADVIAIFDTCFSGGMAKGVPAAQVKRVRVPGVPRNAKAKRGFGKTLAAKLAARGKPTAPPAGAEDVGGGKAVVLMACEEGDYSYETPNLGGGNGVFSYFVIQGIGEPSLGAPADADLNGLLSAEEEFAYAAPLTTAYAPTDPYVDTQVPQLYDGDPTADAFFLVVEPVEPVHDAAVTAVAAAPPIVAPGDVVTVTVTVTNQGNYTENVTVKLAPAPDGDTFADQTVSDLAPGASAVATFEWDTTGAEQGTHTLTAEASIEPVVDADMANNTASTTVTVDEGGSLILRVASIDMLDFQTAGKNLKAVARVNVVDQSGAPADGATVAADWSLDGKSIGSSTGITDALGLVTLTSAPKKAKSGQVFRIAITTVTKADYEYDAAGSVTEATSEPVP